MAIAEQSTTHAGTVGTGEHVVRQGECMASIAAAYGLNWKSLWNHPANYKLKEARQDPNILLPGDRVFIPKKDPKWYSGSTEKKHKFVRKGVPSKIRLKLMDEDKPRKNERYVLRIGDHMFFGTTNADGVLEHSIPPGAKDGVLIMGENQERYPLNLGHLDPIDAIKGVQSRLHNLGFGTGNVSGKLDADTYKALKAFQRQYHLEENGEPDDRTKAKLKEIHGC